MTSLLGPRRFGKTSVLRRVAADLTAVGSLVVWVDPYEVASIADLAVRLDAARRRPAVPQDPMSMPSPLASSCTSG